MTDWNKAVYTDDAPADHVQPSLLHPTPAKALDNAKTVAGHTVAGAGSGLNPLNMATGAWNIGHNTAEDAYAGNYGQAAMDLAGLTKAHQDVASLKAADAFQHGRHLEGILHTISKYAPIIGPLSDDTISKLADGVRDGDYAKIGDGLGNIAAVATPSLLKGTKAIPGVQVATKTLIKSAGENYLNTVRPIVPESAVKSATRAAQDLAAGDAPVSMTRQSFINKMQAAASKSGAASADALDFNKTGAFGDATALKSKLLKYAYDKYTTPNMDGSRSPRSPEGLAAIAELSDRIDNAAGPGPTPPGVLAPDQTAPSGKPSVPHEAVEAWRRDLESTSGAGGNLTPTGTWRDRINPDNAAAIDRAHARIIRGWQDEQDPGIQERRNPTRTASEMRDRLQEAQNRKAAGTPKDIPFFGAIRKGKMPNILQNSILNVPVNTSAAAWKASLAKALETGEWTKTAPALRAGKLATETDTEEGQ